MFDSSINVDYNLYTFNANKLTKNSIECVINFKIFNFTKQKHIICMRYIISMSSVLSTSLFLGLVKTTLDLKSHHLPIFENGYFETCLNSFNRGGGNLLFF